MERKSTTLAVVLLASTIGSADPGRADLTQDTSVERLKEIYVACELRAMLEVMPAGEIARCSDVYETLKLRAFGGDWTRLREWFEKRLIADTPA